MEITGKIKRVIFNKDNFVILAVNTDDRGEVIVKGDMAQLCEEYKYNFEVKETKHEKYGTQYLILNYKIDYDFNSIDSQKEFLKTFLSEKQIYSLYMELDDPLKYIEDRDVMSLCTVTGIGLKTANKILNKYDLVKSRQHVFEKLAKIGLDYKKVNKLPKQVFEDDKTFNYFLKQITANPYTLVQYLGFKEADNIALNHFNISLQDIRRIKAISVSYLKSLTVEGHSYTNLDSMVYELRNKRVQTNILEIAPFYSKDKDFYTFPPDNVALKYIFDLEANIVRRLKSIYEIKNNCICNNIDEIIQKIQEENNITYTEEQIQGIYTVLENNVTLITGLAGTGKTSLTNAIARILEENGYSIKQCALAGRAAQRLKELNGLDSSTIHSLIKYGTAEQLNDLNPIDTDVLIVDEASMLDANIFLALLNATQDYTKLIIIGDSGQLPPIGIANIFFDLLQYPFPLVRLTEIHRQAQASAIITESYKVRNKIPLFNDTYIGNEIRGELKDLELDIYSEDVELVNPVIEHFLLNYKELQDITKLQIVLPYNVQTSGRKLCTSYINKIIQDKVITNKSVYVKKNKDTNLYIKDKVIAKKNTNIEGVRLCNGNVGIITDIIGDNIVVRFYDLNIELQLEKSYYRDNIELAYAISCHALQGSSVERVIIGLDNSSYYMQSCEWLYTAITRAEQYCILVAHNKAIQYSTMKSVSNSKRTFLKYNIEQKNKAQS